MSSIFAHIFSTEYSNEEAYGKLDKYNKGMIKAWADHAKASGDPSPSLIIADKFSGTAHIPFFKACLELGVKPVFGVKVVIQGKNAEVKEASVESNDDDSDDDKPKKTVKHDSSNDHEVILIARNDEGRQNINSIITEGFKVTHNKGYKVITRETLEEFKDGLICISGGTEGLVERQLLNDNYNEAKKIATYFNKLFPENFYLQVKRTSNDVEGQKIEEKIIAGVKQLNKETGVKYVANNDVRFVKKEDYKYHLMRKAIINGKLEYDPTVKVKETENQHLVSISDMLEIFKDMPEAIYNMGDLVDKTDISSFKNRLGKSCLPKFPIPAEFNDDAESYLAHITQEGFVTRWTKTESDYRKNMGGKTKHGHIITEEFLKNEKELYQKRIDFELDVIKKTGFAGYFLIVHELVNWCKKNDIPVGPGRGSGAGSLVLYSLEITNVDPIPHDLLFERFLNPERMSEPDIDIDFSPINRGRVIQHMKDMYGEENTAQILTEGTMAARSVIDSVGRIMGLKPDERNRFKNLVSDELGTTVAKELDTNEKMQELYKKSRAFRRVVKAALEMEKALVSYGKHAGGVVISLGKMSQYAPIYREEGENEPVVQFNKDICEMIGLIKFDILGLKNLDIIQECVRAINAGRDSRDLLNVDDIPLDDALTISLFKKADTYGIFQFESVGMRRLMKDLSPDNFEELVALVALFRPGPLQSKMDKDFIERKFNPSKIVYPHPRLKETLGPTYGTIIYQEQVMSIARELAGYSLGQADILRKAMGKKDMEIMRQQRAMFLNGCMDSFRAETMEITGTKLKSPVNPDKTISVDLNFESNKSDKVKNILKDSNFKFTSLDQVVAVLKDLGKVSDDDINLFKLEVDGMEDKQFYGKYYNELIKNGVPELMKDGLSEEEATESMASVAVSASMFVRFNKIFSLMHKFAAYGFNKSHSVAYALVSFHTAYLKAHYPAQYMAAMLTNESNIDAVSETLAESKRMGLSILKPDINMSEVGFKALTPNGNEKNIVYGVSQIKGVNKAVKYLVSIRKEKGAIKDIFDFYDKYGTFKIIDVVEHLDGTVKETKKTLIGKTVLNNLLNAGVLDSICPDGDPKHRATLQATYHFIGEVVTDMNKRLGANHREIVKRLKKISTDNKEFLKEITGTTTGDQVSLYLKKVTGVDDVSEILEPKNLSNFDFNHLKSVYEKISADILKASGKALTIKEVNDYNEELKTFDNGSEKIEIIQNGKPMIYIKPTTANYTLVPEHGTKECSLKEFELTGMYQTGNPVNFGNIKKILQSKDIICASSKDLHQQVETFGKVNERTGKKYYQTNFAGTVVDIRDFKRTNHETGESYIDVTALVDDGNGIVTVKFNAEKLFLAGKEQRGIDMLKDMMKRDVIIVEGSAANGSYESAGVTIYPKRIGSTNPDIYLPLEDPSLNFVKNEKEVYENKLKEEDLATTAQIGKLVQLLKRNGVAYTQIYEEFKIEELKDLTKQQASKLIGKFAENKPTM